MYQSAFVAKTKNSPKHSYLEQQTHIYYIYGLPMVLQNLDSFFLSFFLGARLKKQTLLRVYSHNGGKNSRKYLELNPSKVTLF